MKIKFENNDSIVLTGYPGTWAGPTTGAYPGDAEYPMFGIMIDFKKYNGINGHRFIFSSIDNNGVIGNTKYACDYEGCINNDCIQHLPIIDIRYFIFDEFKNTLYWKSDNKSAIYLVWKDKYISDYEYIKVTNFKTNVSRIFKKTNDTLFKQLTFDSNDNNPILIPML